MGDEKTYSISEAAEALGVSPETLRSWERRYGLLTSKRTAGGRRRYTEEDIDRLRAFVEIARRRRAKDSADVLGEIDEKP